MLELICCLLNLGTVHQVSQPHSSSLVVQMCVVHICGGTMACKYTNNFIRDCFKWVFKVFIH